ncbi:MAG: CxxC-x17-CxxC domain-containing protein [Patescibacteria group bacterium]|nr:type IV secretion system DNA-binding domain-containing protein [Patescibacteria group bacterium]
MVTLFAKTNFRGSEEVFGIKEDDRRRHVYVIGKTGMGKTNLLQTMVIQDINAGNGLAYVDPHGDTAEALIKFIPKNRLNDVVYFNPADMDNPVAFNVLETVNEEHKHLVASGMMGVFKKIWPDVWSPRMEHILNHTILALLDYPGSTMLGINRMLSDKQFRNKVLNRVKDPIVKSFWVNEFAKWNERYMGEAIAPIQNKVGQFIATPVIRNIISQTKSTIRMREIMDQGKILIINLSKGRIGEEAMQLLGGMAVTKLQLAAMERVDTPEEQRKDFYLYVDEFQNFATESFANILSEARKYRLSLIMAHQYIGQLIREGNPYMRDAIFGNVGTIISFRIGAEDAEMLEKEFTPTVLAYDLVNLPKYNMYLKLMIDGVTGDAFSAQGLPPLSPPADDSWKKVINISRERYGRPRKLIEEKIARWSESLPENFDPRRQSQARGNESRPPQRVENREKKPGPDQQRNDKKGSSKDSQKITTGKETTWYDVLCDECKAPTRVPFKPDGVRGIYCKDCLKEVRRQKAKLNQIEERGDSNRGYDKIRSVNLDIDDESGEAVNLATLKEKSGKKQVDVKGLKELIGEARKLKQDES